MARYKPPKDPVPCQNDGCAAPRSYPSAYCSRTCKEEALARLEQAARKQRSCLECGAAVTNIFALFCPGDVCRAAWAENHPVPA